MVRFIDLGDQITCDGRKQFAWYDTVHDEFVSFSGNDVWETWEDFEFDFRSHFPTTEQIVTGDTHGASELMRFKRLFRWEKT